MGTSIHAFAGSARQCGASYALKYQREISGFFTQEFGSYKYSRKFVRACLKKIRSEAPSLSAFLKGVASNSLLSEEEHALLLLHEEELYHRKLLSKKPHCSAVGVAKSGTNPGAIIGQNWDWSTAYYPWASINRIKISRFPAILSLSYPGLPVCAGINSAGPSSMWTGAGYYPPLCPKIGVPTYGLVLETLLLKDVVTAVKYLQRVSGAGAFIFFLGDRTGKLAIAEGVPGKVFVKFETSAHRANVFEFTEAISAARQKLPGESRCHSIKRNEVFSRTFGTVARSPTIANVMSSLSQPTILVDRPSHATLMQLVADCSRGEMYVRSWRQKQASWRKLSV